MVRAWRFEIVTACLMGSCFSKKYHVSPVSKLEHCFACFGEGHLTRTCFTPPSHVSLDSGVKDLVGQMAICMIHCKLSEELK